VIYRCHGVLSERRPHGSFKQGSCLLESFKVKAVLAPIKARLEVGSLEQRLNRQLIQIIDLGSIDVDNQHGIILTVAQLVI
jgi:hypothetical protein